MLPAWTPIERGAGRYAALFPKAWFDYDGLRRAALNELYHDVFGGSFWENGCMTKPKRFGARPGQHVSGVLETNVYRDAETLDVRHYECRHQLVLFPGKERDLLLAWADFILH